MSTNLDFQKDVSLKEWSWWKVGGKAEFFCTPQNLQELKESCQWAFQQSISITVISGGTNVLISDQGVQGLVISLKHLQQTQVRQTEEEIFIQAQSGTPKHQLMNIFTKEKLAPALFLCGLPGDVGGGVVMNAGIGSNIFPKEFSQIVHKVTVLSFPSFELKTFLNTDLKWDYRSCTGWEKGIIYEVEFKWPLILVEDFSKKLKEVHKKRTSSQPLNKPSCGSVFKNPPHAKSGQLIEELGLKGFSIGGAEVSQKHANFIVNKGSATAQDIHRIICHIQHKVKEAYGIDLEPEIHYLGTWNHI